MARIPIIEQQSIIERPPPEFNAQLRQADTSASDSMMRSIQGAANSIGGSVDSMMRTEATKKAAIDRAAAKAQEEADGVASAEAMLELDSRLGTLNARFEANRGLQASERRGETLGDMNKARADVGNLLPPGSARNAFMTRSADRLMGYRRSVESHATQQFDVARNDIVDKRSAQAIAIAESTAGDQAFWNQTNQETSLDIMRNATSVEAGMAAVDLFAAKSAAAYTRGLVSKGRIAEAEAFMNSQHETLGSQFDETKKVVDIAVGNSAVQQAVNELVKKSTNEDGLALEKTMRENVESVQGMVPEGMEKKFDIESRKRIAAEAARFTATRSTYRNAADQDDFHGAPINPGTEAWLEKYDAKYLTMLRDKRTSRLRSAEAHRRAGSKSSAAENKAQRDFDEAFKNRFRAELVDNPTVDTQEFTATFMENYKQRFGEVRAPSYKAETGTELDKAKHGQRLEDKTDSSDNALRNELSKSLTNQYKIKGKPLDQEELNRRVGSMLNEADAVRDRESRPLTPVERSQLLMRATSSVETVKPGFIRDTVVRKPYADRVLNPDSPAPGAGDDTTPPPPPKKPKKKYKMVSGKLVAE